MVSLDFNIILILEDLVLAEDRTTEADRELIMEGKIQNKVKIFSKQHKYMFT